MITKTMRRTAGHRSRTRAVGMLAVLGLVAASCGDSDDTDTASNEDDPSDVSVGLVLNGELGDEAFFDSAARGVNRAADEFGVDVNVIEAGLDAAGWEPALRSAAASGDYDLIITGTAPMADVLGPIADEFTDQRFVFYDASLDGPNIHSITYAQNEAAYLGGVVAGGVTAGDLEGANADSVIGFVGGLDLPVINDFRVGYEQGARSVDDSITVETAFAGDFGDPGRGRELAEAQIDSGADVVFQVAGGTGLGVFDAATARDVYAIGVDTNQNSLAPGTVLTSVQKNVDVSLYRAIERYAADDLPFGETDELGLADGGVGLAKDDLYEEHVPQDVRDMADEAEQAIIDGEIQVESTLDE